MGNWQTMLRSGLVFGRRLCDITLRGCCRGQGAILVDEFLQASVNAVPAQNNKRDAFCPFGNSGLPKVAFFAAQNGGTVPF